MCAFKTTESIQWMSSFAGPIDTSLLMGAGCLQRGRSNTIHVGEFQFDTSLLSSVIVDGQDGDEPGLVEHLRNQAQKDYNYLIGVAPTLAIVFRATGINALLASLRVGRQFALENDRERLRRVFVSRGWHIGAFERSMERLYRPCTVNWDDDTEQNLWRIVANRHCSPDVLPAFVFPETPYDAVDADFVPFCAVLLLQALVENQRGGVSVRVTPSMPGFDSILPPTLAYTLRHVMMGRDADNIAFDYDRLWGTVMLLIEDHPRKRRHRDERRERSKAKHHARKRQDRLTSPESDDDDEQPRLILTGAAHLLDSYPEDVQKSIGEIKAQLRMMVASHNAWPKDTEALDAMIEKAIAKGNTECVKKKWPEVESSEGVVRMMRATVSQFRGFVKTEAHKLVDEYYRFEDRKTWANEKDIKTFVTTILEAERTWYVFKEFDEGNPTASSGFVENPIFVDLVRNVYFRQNASSSDGTTHSDQFDLDTTEFFAFNYSAIYAALDEWKTGKAEHINFETGKIRSQWVFLVAVINQWRQECEDLNPDGNTWNSLVSKLREAVLSGVGPVDSQDFSVPTGTSRAAAARARNGSHDSEDDEDRDRSEQQEGSKNPSDQDNSGENRATTPENRPSTTSGVTGGGEDPVPKKTRATVEGRRLRYRKQQLAAIGLTEDAGGISRLRNDEPISVDGSDSDDDSDDDDKSEEDRRGRKRRATHVKDEFKGRHSSHKTSNRTGKHKSYDDDEYMESNSGEDDDDNVESNEDAEDDGELLPEGLTADQKQRIKDLTPTNLSAYPGDARKTIQLTKTHLRILIATTNAFPKTAEVLNGLITRSMQSANDEGADQNLPLIAATPHLLTMLKNEPSRFRNTLKTTARAVVDDVYAFATAKKWKEPDSVRKYLKRLLKHHEGRFTMKDFNLANPNASTGIFENPALGQLISEHFYRAKSQEADARTHPTAFTPYSTEFIALNLVVLENVLEEWSSGKPQSIAFSSESYRGEWIWIMNSIQRFDQLSKAQGDDKWRDIVARLEASVS
ncbi:hypothetical protein CALCODRAFT_528690 [Calocera cornea HHB12733]|uniref:DUF6532 domain-containing protein n=1 Tax=Calocera cornea HHB12733 TaxID=1353952 RepID=A0A165J0Q2_9BASI|nr:hypothetical protein CALCODRAFT_528690 [Calocera cornea HHB12733]